MKVVFKKAYCKIIGENVWFNREVELEGCCGNVKEIYGRYVRCHRKNCPHYECTLNEDRPKDFKGELVAPFKEPK